MAIVLLAGCDGPKKQNGVLAELPGPDTVEHVETPSTLPADLGNSMTDSRPAGLTPSDWLPAADLSDRWKAIVIHHLASETGSLDLIDRQHRRLGWQDGCGYHFVVGNGSGSGSGEVEMSPRWRHQVIGAPCSSSPGPSDERIDNHNEYTISIVLVGDLNDHGLGLEQMDSLVDLVGFLMEQCHIPASRVLKHSDLADTGCPGRHFSIWDLKRRLESR